MEQTVCRWGGEGLINWLIDWLIDWFKAGGKIPDEKKDLSINWLIYIKEEDDLGEEEKD